MPVTVSTGSFWKDSRGVLYWKNHSGLDVQITEDPPVDKHHDFTGTRYAEDPRDSINQALTEELYSHWKRTFNLEIAVKSLQAQLNEAIDIIERFQWGTSNTHSLEHYPSGCIKCKSSDDDCEAAAFLSSVSKGANE